MHKARYKKYALSFKRPAGTSRGVLTQRDTYFIILEKDSTVGIGECSTLEGLSIDHVPGYEKKLQEICGHINEYVSNPHQKLIEWPSICFGIETALKDIENGGKRELFPSEFTEGKEGIYINGLIWMGSFDFMKEQLDAKLSEGYKCIKVKIGGIDFEEEINLLSQLRKRYSPADIELRVDANGAFENEEAMNKLQHLSEFHIHSIEQPIKQGNWEKMAELCKTSPIPIALDEDLVVTHVLAEKEKLVSKIKPHYLILKPPLLGGFESCREWIALAEKYDTKWWVTSALESNIGLNAIAQWTYKASLNPSEGGTISSYGYEMADPILYSQLKGFVKEHRSVPTEAENAFWQLVRGKQLDGYKFRRQHIIGQYIADFVCLTHRLIVEIDGLIHYLPENAKSDKERTGSLQKKGFTVLRFSNNEVIGDPKAVVAKVLAVLSKQSPIIPPSGGDRGAALPQGLGTGQLYMHNIASPLVIENSRLWYKGNNWNVEEILNKN